MAPTDARIDLPERYRVVRHVANGGMASVWAAEDGLLGRLVAVKVLAAHVGADPSSRVRFEREARTAARLSDHPNIVTIYDIGEHAGTAFIVMELYQGGTVADRLREGQPIPRPQALEWLAQAGAALDHAHSRDVVHRDVKPANLLLDERGRLGVGDFGIARLVDESSLTQAGQVLGTAAYLSPEQALGQGATAASDRYSLAVVAFELLTGRRPFAGDHAAAQARQHVEAPPPGSGLGAAVDEVLDRALAKDPDDRFPTAERFVDELGHAVRRATGPPTEPTRQATGVWGAAGGAAGAAAGGAARAADGGRRLSPVAPPDEPSPGGGAGRRRGAMALAGIAAVALAVALAALLAGGSDDPERASNPPRTEPAQEQQTQPPQEDDPAPGGAAEEPGDDAEAPPSEPGPDNEDESGAGPPASGESPAALNDRGYSLLQAGNAQAAIPYLERSVQGFDQQGGAANSTQFGYALYNLGEAYAAVGRYDEAIKMYERRLQVSPNDRPEVVRAAIKEAKKARKGGGDGD